MKITTKNNEEFQFRTVTEDDGIKLGTFFEVLSDDTRSKFGPHPLTREYALKEIRSKNSDHVSRFIIASTDKIVGYFIVDYGHYPHEKERYQSYGVELDFAKDPVLAPCISDDYQNLGVASQAMSLLIKHLKKRAVRSLVLMGGTQEPNKLSRHFYTKFGFTEQGEFYTDFNGLNNIDMRLIL